VRAASSCNAFAIVTFSSLYLAQQPYEVEFEKNDYFATFLTCLTYVKTCCMLYGECCPDDAYEMD